MIDIQNTRKDGNIRKNYLLILLGIMIHSNKKYTSIEDLTQKPKNLIWIGMISVSLLTGYIIYLKPEGLHVPLYIAIIALAVFLVTGLAILLHGRVAKERYHNLMQSIILLMSIIPFWIAFDPEEKECKLNFSFIAGDLACRIGFGIGASILVGILILSFSTLKKL